MLDPCRAEEKHELLFFSINVTLGIWTAGIFDLQRKLDGRGTQRRISQPQSSYFCNASAQLL